MKITFSPANSNDSIIIDCELSELNAVLDRLSNRNNRQPAPVAQAKTIQPAQPQNNQDQMERFLASVYLYPASNTADSGKGRYVANILSDMKTHSIGEIVKKANVQTKTVHKNVARLRMVGATVSVEDDCVTLISIPNTRFTKKRRGQGSVTVSKASTEVKQSSTGNGMAISALSGFKLS